jgi:hypothetical protein
MDGNLLASWKIGGIIPNAGMDSSERLSVFENEKSLLIKLNMDES